MNQNIKISRVDILPLEQTEEIVPAANHENFRAIQWLVRDWDSEVNQFDEPGEAFYVAEINIRLVGVRGLNRDPYVDDAPIARLRRLYFLPQFRRLGIGRKLVLRARQDANNHFSVIRLRALDEGSATFFESIGFTKVNVEKEATHEMRCNLV